MIIKIELTVLSNLIFLQKMCVYSITTFVREDFKGLSNSLFNTSNVKDLFLGGTSSFFACDIPDRQVHMYKSDLTRSRLPFGFWARDYKTRLSLVLITDLCAIFSVRKRVAASMAYAKEKLL